MAQPDRVEKLRAMLEKSPDDPFLLYALGMEHKQSNPAEAVRLFERTIQADPGQCYAYYQIGQTRQAMGDDAGARAAYQQGLAAADRVGDGHARGEIAAALEMME